MRPIELLISTTLTEQKPIASTSKTKSPRTEMTSKDGTISLQADRAVATNEKIGMLAGLAAHSTKTNKIQNSGAMATLLDGMEKTNQTSRDSTGKTRTGALSNEKSNLEGETRGAGSGMKLHPILASLKMKSHT
jgi:hypothetical protein